MFVYPVTLTPDEVDGGFVVSFADIPEAISQGNAESEALAAAKDALESEASHSVAAGLLRAYAIVLESDAIAKLIEQPPRWWRSREGIDAIAGNFSGRVHGAPHCFV